MFKIVLFGIISSLTSRTAWSACDPSQEVCNCVCKTVNADTKEITTNPFCCAFDIDDKQERALRDTVDTLPVSPVILESSTFDTFYRQIMIPSTVVELHKKVSQVRLSPTEVKAIRFSLAHGALKWILEEKQEKDKSHPPYIRIGCSGRGSMDNAVNKYIKEHYSSPDPFVKKIKLGASWNGDAEVEELKGGHVMQDDDDTIGSPVILEIWPAQHYSTIHSHGDTTGIMHVVTGQIDVMAYDSLAWNAKKVGMLTLSEGQCGWLDQDNFGIHKVFSPMKPGEFAASFHVYLNKEELPLVVGDNGRILPVNLENGKLVKADTEPEPEPSTDGKSELSDRRRFHYINETYPHKKDFFDTASDISWKTLRVELAMIMAKYKYETIISA